MRRLLWIAALNVVAPLVLAANPTPKDEVSAIDAPASAGSLARSRADSKDILSWKTLSQVEEVKVNDKLVPKFSAQITALDAKEVRLQGFMMPLEPGTKQKRFLLCKKPIAFNMEPIVISGKLSVLKDDPTGLWYRVTDAVLILEGKM